MEELIIWLEDNTTIAMMAIIAIIVIITFISSIIIGKKRNKAFASNIARKEGEDAAQKAFAQKLVIAQSVEDASLDKEDGNIKEDDIGASVELDIKTGDETAVNPVTVKPKQKRGKTKAESSFSPRKKSVTVIDPEYVASQKQVRTKTVVSSKSNELSESKEDKVVGPKWEIHKSGDSYYYLLRASNGETLTTSEAYSTESGARSGINTLRKNVETGDMRIDRDKNDNYCFKLTSRPPFPRLLCVGQSYKYKKSAEGNFESVKRLALADLPIVNVISDTLQFEEITVDLTHVEQSTMRGQWEIVEREDGKYGTILRASNGVLILSGEPRASRSGCLSYIETIKKNLKNGFVKVQSDKNGQYCYKLYSAQKRIVCTGEKYESVQSAVSSAESLVRYAENATITDCSGVKNNEK